MRTNSLHHKVENISKFIFSKLQLVLKYLSLPSYSLILIEKREEKSLVDIHNIYIS